MRCLQAFDVSESTQPGRAHAIVALFLAIAGAVVPVAAQNDQWTNLTSQVMQLYTSGKATEAIPLAKEALEVAKSAGKENVTYALSLNNLALLEAATGKPSDARNHFGDSINIMQRIQSSELYRPLLNLAYMEAGQGQYAAAESGGEKALALIVQNVGEKSLITASTQSSLSQFYAGGGNPVRAEFLLKQAIATEEELSPESQELGRTYALLGTLYQSEGSKSDAQAMFRKAIGVLQGKVADDDPLMARIKESLWQVGDHDSGALPSTETLFDQCMASQFQVCVADCVRNYHFDFVYLIWPLLRV